MDVLVPDIGDFKDVPVIEVLVKPGDEIAAEASLVTLESDKATMEVPSPAAGVVREIAVKVGDKVSQGTLIARLDAKEETSRPRRPRSNPPRRSSRSRRRAAGPRLPSGRPREGVPRTAAGDADAAEGVRRADRDGAAAEARAVGGPARDRRGGVPQGARRPRRAQAGARARRRSRTRHRSGPKGRILNDDVHKFVKSVMTGSAAPAAAAAGSGLAVAPWPKVDFAKFGPVESKPLSRIKKISGPNLHRNWVMIPARHEPRRRRHHRPRGVPRGAEQGEREAGVKVTMLAFLIKACVAALKKFPELQRSLDGDNLVTKKYYHIGFAADTPHGLVVPVIKDADQKGVIADRAGDGRARGQGARRQARAGRHAGRHLHDLARSAASAARTSRRSSTRRRSRSWASAARRCGRCGTATVSSRG